MRVSNEKVERFKQLYKEHHGVDLTEGEARVMLTNLVKLYELILQPLPDESEFMQPSEKPAVQTDPEES